MFDGWSQTVFRNVEIDERAAHKDSGGMDLLIECVLAVDQQDAQAFSGEQASALETSESGADDGYVIIAHKKTIAQSPLLYKVHGKKITTVVGLPSSAVCREEQRDTIRCTLRQDLQLSKLNFMTFTRRT